MLRDHAHRFGDHEFFVGVYHPHGDAAVVGRNRRFATVVARSVKLHAKKPEILTYARPDYWRVLADSAGKNKSVEPTERRGKRPNAFPDLIAKHRDRLGRSTVIPFATQQITHIGTGFGYPQQPGLMIDHMVELPGSHLFSLSEIPDEARVQIA